MILHALQHTSLRRRGALLRWGLRLAILVGTLILVGHGCHGDDIDHELCVPKFESNPPQASAE